MPMKNKTTVLLTICVAISIQSVYAATIPVGTTLFVQTNETIVSTDPVGKKFAGQLYRDVVANGKVLLRAGTGVVGRVKKSRGLGSTPLILNVTQLTIGQRLVPITTVEGFRADNTRFTTRRGISVGRSVYFQLPTGTRMQFRLAKPVDLGGSHDRAVGR
jgi:membrane-associated protease RseP (regulator of RpoE activity)